MSTIQIPPVENSFKGNCFISTLKTYVNHQKYFRKKARLTVSKYC